METRWTWKVFPSAHIPGYEKLTPEEFQDAAQLRAEIFVNEQGYAYNDLDDADRKALHLQCYLCNGSQKDLDKTQEAMLIAYARLMLPAYNNGVLEVGRIVVHEKHRRGGVGSELMRRMVTKIDTDFPDHTAQLSVTEDKYSAHLPTFYNKFGFKMKEGNPLTTSPHYHYKNFTCTIKDMLRPPARLARPQPESKADNSAAKDTKNDLVDGLDFPVHEQTSNQLIFHFSSLSVRQAFWTRLTEPKNTMTAATQVITRAGHVNKRTP